MMRRVGLVSVLVVLASTVVASAETLESVEKKIAQLADKCRSVEMTSRETAEMSGNGITMVTVTDSRFQCVRKGGAKVLARQESKVKRTIKMAKQRDQTEEGTTLVICDGQFIYVLTHAEDQQTATKSSANDQSDMNPLDAKASFERLHKQYSLKLLPDAAVDGKDAYVIEASGGKKDAPELFARVVTYFDKKTGLPLKSVCYDKSGKTLQTLVVSDIKSNIDIPQDRFVFKAPAGVQVLDMTRLNGPATTQPDSTPVSPELPDE